MTCESIDIARINIRAIHKCIQYNPRSSEPEVQRFVFLMTCCCCCCSCYLSCLVFCRSVGGVGVHSPNRWSPTGQAFYTHMQQVRLAGWIAPSDAGGVGDDDQELSSGILWLRVCTLVSYGWLMGTQTPMIAPTSASLAFVAASLL